jgi:hypothetical protein
MPPPPSSVPPPPLPQGRAAVATGGKRSLIGALLIAALLMAGVAAGVWYVFLRARPEASPGTQISQTSENAAPASVSGESAGTSTAPVQQPPPAATPGTSPAAPSGQEPAAPEPKSPASQQSANPPIVSPSTPAPVLPGRDRLRQRGSPGPSSEPSAPSSAPSSEPTTGNEPAAASPSEPEPAPAPAVPPVVTQQADQVIQSGLRVAFRVTPPDAYVLVGRTVLGPAEEWSGAKGSRTYDFSEPGLYFIRLRKPGMKDYKIAVQAEARSGVTTISARLQPLPAADVDASDLRTYRVREAVAFRVQPSGAAVNVDGQFAGLARRFSGGGFLRGKGEWLELAPGKHRISIKSPGFQPQDILVEVTATADRDRERIDVVLTPGGGGE